MSSRFVGLVGSLPPEEQWWLSLFITTNLASKSACGWATDMGCPASTPVKIGVNCEDQEMYIVQDQPLPPSETLLLPPLSSLYKVFTRFSTVLPPSQHTRPNRWWRIWRFGRKTLTRVRIKGYWSKWPFMRHKQCCKWPIMRHNTSANGPSCATTPQFLFSPFSDSWVGEFLF